MQTTLQSKPYVDVRHPLLPIGPTVAVYVWQYPMRLFHWGMVVSLVILSFTGYYIHDPFIVSQVRYPFLMGWFRFVHEACGMAFMALFLLRLYLFFAGNRWSNWRQFVPIHAEQWKEMIEVSKYYGFLRQTPIARIGHNAMAAFSYLGIYSLMVMEIVTGLVLWNWLQRNVVLDFLVGWIPRLVTIPNLRLFHFFTMFIFFAFGIFHVYLCLLISRVEKPGLVDSILIGYKILPVAEVEEDEKRAAAGLGR